MVGNAYVLYVIFTFTFLLSIITILIRNPSTLPSSCLHWQFKGTARVSLSISSLWKQNIKRLRALAQWAWQMLRLSARNRKHVHQLSSSPNEKNKGHEVQIHLSFLFCHRCGKERSETQGLAAWSSQHRNFIEFQ